MRRISRPALWTATLALLLGGIAVVSAIIPVRQISEQQSRLQAASSELSSLQQENRVLEAEVEALQTRSEIERLARERLGYVMPGEVPYVVVEPGEDSATETANTSEPGSTLPPDLPWYQDLWEFLTGADLANG
jgi:cell division protein FtsL